MSLFFPIFVPNELSLDSLFLHLKQRHNCKPSLKTGFNLMIPVNQENSLINNNSQDGFPKPSQPVCGSNGEWVYPEPSHPWSTTVHIVCMSELWLRTGFPVAPLVSGKKFCNILNENMNLKKKRIMWWRVKFEWRHWQDSDLLLPLRMRASYEWPTGVASRLCWETGAPCCDQACGHWDSLGTEEGLLRNSGGRW